MMYERIVEEDGADANNIGAQLAKQNMDELPKNI